MSSHSGLPLSSAFASQLAVLLTLQRCKGTWFCPFYLSLSASYSTSVFLIKISFWGNRVANYTTLYFFSFSTKMKGWYISLNVAIKSEVHKWEASFSNTVTCWIRNGENASAIKNIDCSSRGWGFDSQHPHVGSELPLIPVQGIQWSLLSSTCTKHTHTWCTARHVGKTPKNIKTYICN